MTELKAAILIKKADGIESEMVALTQKELDWLVSAVNSFARGDIPGGGEVATSLAHKLQSIGCAIDLVDELPSAGSAIVSGLRGEIKVGDKLIWDTTVPNAYERVCVKQIIDNSEGTWILLSGEQGDFWNEENQVRELCVRDE